jgi:hypothetical protein
MKRPPRSMFAKGWPMRPARSVGTAQCAANSRPHPPAGAQASLGAARREAWRFRQETRK